ncbi:MAG TPA: hypothetical protein VJ783_02905 [Pirellulales bacterium]|nr:hypothetical protein [Pirellulales bacterium]
MFKSLGEDGKYQVIPQSISFPGLSTADLQAFVDRRGTMGEIALDEELAKWVRGLREAS